MWLIPLIRLIPIVAALSAACTYPLPAPTAPTPNVAAAPAPAIALEVLPSSPDYATGTAQIGVRTRAADGSVTHADVTCTSTSGRVLPARFDPRSQGGTELAQTTVPTRVTCTAGVLEDGVDVDMSAWHLDVLQNTFIPSGDGAGETRLLLMPRPRIANAPATRLTIDWGDGAVEISPFVPLTSNATMMHRYRVAGLYLAKGRISGQAAPTSDCSQLLAVRLSAKPFRQDPTKTGRRRSIMEYSDAPPVRPRCCHHRGCRRVRQGAADVADRFHDLDLDRPERAAAQRPGHGHRGRHGVRRHAGA